jgi:hypothetical protein
MQKLRLLLPFLALLLGGLYTACNKDDFGANAQADVAFAGRITDQNGQPVEGAQVRAGGELAATDANGIFRLQSVRLNAKDAKISVAKIGYFDFSRAYAVEDDALQYVDIQLIEKKQVGVFAASAGGTLQVPGGARLAFPANAVADANGNPYTGSVRIFAHHLAPDDPNIGRQMPGDLRATDLAGETSLLATFGMLAVEMESPSGQKLQVASGSSVEMRMPILPSQAGAAPSEIQLWHYQLDVARWQEEGKAQKVGNEYVGSVSHFSWWNCDIPLPLVGVTGKVFLRSTATPLANAHVVFSYGNYSGSCHGWTDENGCFAGNIPKDVVLLLEIFVDGCDLPVYSANVGPFDQDVNLPDIIVNVSSQTEVSVTGRVVDCDGQPVPNGYAWLRIGTRDVAAFTENDGTFALNFISCDNTLTGALTGYDLTALLESAPQSINLSNSPIEMGDMSACVALEEYIEYTLDGQNFTAIEPRGGQDGNIVFIQTTLDSSQTNQNIYFSFNHNTPTGIFPFDYLIINTLYSQNPNTVTTELTSFGAVGEPMIGTFGGTFQNFTGSTHTISGSYRVLRDY